jgi:CRISPR-associated endonuclease Cas2
MTFFICYDITDDRLRIRLSKHLEKAGSRRIQKSVFVAHDFDKKEITTLKASVQKILRGSAATRTTDSVLYIPIESDYFKQVVWQGDPTVWEKTLEKTYAKVL